jgi:RNA polymerase sigma factor (TIGR02999 family)
VETLRVRLTAPTRCPSHDHAPFTSVQAPVTLTPEQSEVAPLFAQWRAGDKQAEQRLMDALYPALRVIARRLIRPVAHRLSLRATELAHEAFLLLMDQRLDWEGRTHFLGVAARVTRRVLIDLVRERETEKRGAGVETISLELDPGQDTDIAVEGEHIDWLQLEQSLQQLEGRDPIASRVVELRYFGGLNNEEVAETLDVGVATVVRHWKFARGWLHSRL